MRTMEEAIGTIVVLSAAIILGVTVRKVREWLAR
jgi:hypothetical protein